MTEPRDATTERLDFIRDEIAELTKLNSRFDEHRFPLTLSKLVDELDTMPEQPRAKELRRAAGWLLVAYTTGSGDTHRNAIKRVEEIISPEKEQA